MRHDPLYMTWTISCPSLEDLNRVRNWLQAQVGSDMVIRNEIIGGGSRRVEHHRLGDYFEEVQLLAGPPSSPEASLRVLFHRRPDAGRFWKDIMVRVLGSIRTICENATTSLHYRGDEVPQLN